MSLTQYASQAEAGASMWHQMLRNHASPDGFLANLNATVESIRTVMFVLQNDKAALPDVDACYADWQRAMKDDPITKWLPTLGPRSYSGHGPTLFSGLSKRLDLKLVSRLEFSSGAVAMRYEPRK
jgi:hypothetical protein